MLNITIATGDYDRIRALREGAVRVVGCEQRYSVFEPEDLMVRGHKLQEFDVCELSLATQVIDASRGKNTYLAIPVFISRKFRHSAFFIRTDRGIDRPEDLRGKKIGVSSYAATGAIWQRGMLSDDYGIQPGEMTWVVGPVEKEKGDAPRAARRLETTIPGVDIHAIADDACISELLEDGHLDAAFLPRPPSCFLRQAPGVGQLFPDHRTAEKLFYKKSGIHPIIHVMGVRRELVQQHPWLPGRLSEAFSAAKDIAIENLDRLVALSVTLPWIGAELAETRAVLGTDYWPYGFKNNEREIRTFIRYLAEQSLIREEVPLDAIFALASPDKLVTRTSSQAGKVQAGQG
jgi:4,5-dihydroxyphthalate decarboxylase